MELDEKWWYRVQSLKVEIGTWAHEWWEWQEAEAMWQIFKCSLVHFFGTLCAVSINGERSSYGGYTTVDRQYEKKKTLPVD